MHKPTDTHSNLRICPAHLEYARELDRNHGRAIAKNYLRQVLNPDYMSPYRLGAVKHAEKALERANFQPKIQRPPNGWQFAIRTHIQRVGSEILKQYPSIGLRSLRQEINKSYPFGSKANYPYRVWRKELKAYLKQIEPEQLSQQLAESYQFPKRREA